MWSCSCCQIRRDAHLILTPSIRQCPRAERGKATNDDAFGRHGGPFGDLEYLSYWSPYSPELLGQVAVPHGGVEAVGRLGCFCVWQANLFLLRRRSSVTFLCLVIHRMMRRQRGKPKLPYGSQFRMTGCCFVCARLYELWASPLFYCRRRYYPLHR